MLKKMNQKVLLTLFLSLAFIVTAHSKPYMSDEDYDYGEGPKELISKSEPHFPTEYLETKSITDISTDKSLTSTDLSENVSENSPTTEYHRYVSENSAITKNDQYLSENSPTTENSVSSTTVQAEQKSELEVKCVLNEPQVAYISLNLSNLNLRSNVENLRYVTSGNVKSLILQNNRLHYENLDIFESILNSFSHLEHLDLSGNEFAVEDVLSKHCFIPNLKTLILDDNSGMSLDDMYFQCQFDSKLKKLSLQRNKIDDLFNLKYLKNLEYIDLSENNLETEIDNILGYIPKSVKVLKLIKTNLKQAIIQLTNLEELYLDGNEFHILSSNDCEDNSLCLIDLLKIKKLTLSNCEINVIEKDAFKGMPELKVLDISGNDFTLVPSNEIFRYLPSLQYLNMSRNKIDRNKDFSEANNLVQLDLNEMKIESYEAEQTFRLFKKNMPHLKKLSLKSSPFLWIDEMSLPSLEELDLSGTHLITPPFYLSKFYNLHKLNLSHNYISEVHAINFKDLKSLKELDISNNKIKTLSIGILKELPDDANVLL